MLIDEGIAEISGREDLDARQKGDLLEALIFSLTKDDLLAYANMESVSEYIDADEHSDSIHPAVAVGAGVAALGVGLTIASKSRGKKGKPCGEGHISQTFECHVEEEGKPATNKPIEELSDQENQAIETLFSEKNLTASTIKKIQVKANRIKKAGEGITNNEAMALGAYVDDFSHAMNAPFSNASGFILNDDTEYKAQVLAATRGATNAIKKLPKITPERIADDGGEKFGGILIHHATINNASNMSEIERRFEKGKKNVPIDRFFSTTHDPFGKPPFNENANLEIRVTPILSGKGSGVLVDSFKNKIKEDEVLFPPDTQFNVKDAYKKGSKYIISLEEVQL